MTTERQPLIRDMELVRKLLIYIADNGSNDRSIPSPTYPEYSDELVAHHLEIMHKHKLFNGREVDGGWLLRTLTWEGHDFVEAARDDTIWNSAKKQGGQHFSSLSLEVVKQLLVKASLNAVGLSQP